MYIQIFLYFLLTWMKKEHVAKIKSISQTHTISLPIEKVIWLIDNTVWHFEALLILKNE